MFDWLKNIWFGSKPVEFESAYGMAESVERLKAATQRRSIFSGLAHQAAAGSVKESRVSLQRVIPMVGNAFKPFFIGRFGQRNGKVVLAGRFRMNWFVRLFMGFWFAGIALGTVASMVAATRSHHSALFFFPGMAMLIAGMGMVSLGAWFSRNDPAWLSDVIRNALTEPKTAAPASSASGAHISNNRPPRTILVTAGVLAVFGAMSITSAMTGIQSYHARPRDAVVTHFTDSSLQRFVALYGALLLGLSYGIYRRRLPAWRAGFVFLFFGQAYFILTLLTSPEFSHAAVLKVFGFVASLVVTLIWGRWWYAQRPHFGK
ncbi:MAG: hypothetical protein ACYDDO_03715 [Acidiferrobacterales bacterium]